MAGGTRRVMAVMLIRLLGASRIGSKSTATSSGSGSAAGSGSGSPEEVKDEEEMVVDEGDKNGTNPPASGS